MSAEQPMQTLLRNVLEPMHINTTLTVTLYVGSFSFYIDLALTHGFAPRPPFSGQVSAFWSWREGCFLKVGWSRLRGLAGNSCGFK